MPPAALAAARERQQAERERRYPGSLVSQGVTYAGGALHVGPLEQVPKADGSGWVRMQRFTLIVRKTVMATPPAKRQTFTSVGETWRVDEVGGQSPHALGWIIKGVRFADPPGS